MTAASPAASTGADAPAGHNQKAAVKMADSNGWAFTLASSKIAWPCPPTHDMPWRPRAMEIRGRAEAVAGPTPVIRIHPEQIISWGLDDDDPGARYAHDAGR